MWAFNVKNLMDNDESRIEKLFLLLHVQFSYNTGYFSKKNVAMITCKMV